MNPNLYAILIINSNVNREPRVLKTIEALKAIKITPIIFSQTKSFEGCICFEIPQIIFRRRHLHYNVFLRKSISALLILKRKAFAPIENIFFTNDKLLGKKILDKVKPYKEGCKMVIAHHLENLPMASFVSTRLKNKLIFNAHEYYPEQFIENESWLKGQKRLLAIGNKYLKKCHKIFTVCNGILNRYEREFSLINTQQVLITNAIKYKNLNPTAVGSKIKLIHHGIANRNRKLELMIQVADFTNKDKFEFYFILIPSSYDLNYYNYLKDEIGKRKNCFLVDPVPTEVIPDYINQFDLGFYMYDNSSNFNMIHYLPNKLFEFIQARCGVVIGPYVEMQPIVTDNKIGVVVGKNTVQAMSDELNKISFEDVKIFKENAGKTASTLSGENEIKKMQQVFEGLINK